MNKMFSAFAALAVGVLFVSVSSAAPIITYAMGTSAGGKENAVFSIDPNGETYDTINFSAVALDGFTFNQLETTAGTLKFVPGNDDTDFLGTATIAVGLSMVGTVDTNTELSGVITTFGGPPTSSLAGPFAELVLGQNTLNRGTQINIRFANAGAEIADFAYTATVWGVPEPGTLAMAGLSLIGLAFRRRLA